MSKGNGGFYFCSVGLNQELHMGNWPFVGFLFVLFHLFLFFFVASQAVLSGPGGHSGEILQPCMGWWLNACPRWL